MKVELPQHPRLDELKLPDKFFTQKDFKNLLAATTATWAFTHFTHNFLKDYSEFIACHYQEYCNTVAFIFSQVLVFTYLIRKSQSKIWGVVLTTFLNGILVYGSVISSQNIYSYTSTQIGVNANENCAGFLPLISAEPWLPSKLLKNTIRRQEGDIQYLTQKNKLLNLKIESLVSQINNKPDQFLIDFDSGRLVKTPIPKVKPKPQPDDIVKLEEKANEISNEGSSNGSFNSIVINTGDTLSITSNMKEKPTIHLIAPIPIPQHYDGADLIRYRVGLTNSTNNPWLFDPKDSKVNVLNPQNKPTLIIKIMSDESQKKLFLLDIAATFSDYVHLTRGHFVYNMSLRVNSIDTIYFDIEFNDNEL